MTFAHFSVSSAMNCPKSAGDPGMGTPVMSRSCAFSLESARPSLTALFSLSMIFTGTFFGTARPNEYSRRGAAQGFAAIQRQQSARDERGCGTGRARDHSAGSDADPPEYDAEIQALSGPISTIPVPLAGDIEDTATNAVDAASRLRRIVENLYGIVGIELMHAAQAIDLRLRDDLRVR